MPAPTSRHTREADKLDASSSLPHAREHTTKSSSPAACGDVEHNPEDSTSDGQLDNDEGDAREGHEEGSGLPHATPLSPSEAAEATAAAFARAVMLLVGSRAALTFGLAAVTGRKLSSASRSFFSSDTVRQAVFMGGFSSVYVALRWLLSERRSLMQGRVSKAFVAGSLAGLSIAVDDTGRARALAAYMLSRAAALTCHSGVRQKLLPNLWWFPAAVFAACEVPIM